MRIDLTDTSAAQIDAALTLERHRRGSPAVGMVLTLVVLTDEAGQDDALRAATGAAREHPCRILAVIPRQDEGEPRLDAEIHVGYETGPGETVVMRLHGPLSRHPASVVVPLLLADTPVVAWWSGEAPTVPAEDRVGALAGRRITDSAAFSRSTAVLIDRGTGYRDGDTDLAWARATPWRALLAAALDQPHDPIVRGSVHAERDNPTASLLSAWLADKLGVHVDRETSGGPGITAIRLTLDRGDIAITRPDGRLATLSRPDQPDRRVGLHRRSTAELLVEELRWLDADEVYGETARRVARELRGQPATSATNGATNEPSRS